MTKESWKQIEGYDGYEISDLGNVRCWRKRNRNALPPTSPREVKSFPNRSGYPKVVLGFKGPTQMIHRLVAEAFVDGRAPGLEVAHSNGDKTDNRASNLRWVTRAENHADKRLHGTSGRKIDIDTAREIRRQCSEGKARREVAAQFALTYSTVGKIVRGDLWEEAA